METKQEAIKAMKERLSELEIISSKLVLATNEFDQEGYIFQAANKAKELSDRMFELHAKIFKDNTEGIGVGVK